MTVGDFAGGKPVGSHKLALWVDKSGLAHRVERAIPIKPVKGAGYLLPLADGGYAICKEDVEIVLAETER